MSYVAPVGATDLMLERRSPTQPGGPISAALREHRGELRRALASLGVRRPRVFGSVARGEDEPDSDLDLLVELPRHSYVLREQVREAAEAMLHVRVNVSTPELLKPEIKDLVVDQAVPL
jgi:predicted nucleotidyltransferase